MGLDTHTDSLEQKSAEYPAGEQIGQSADSLVGFHGAEPIAQEAIVALAGSLTGTVDGTINNVAAAACAGGATPTAAQVDTAVAALALSTNLALKEIQTILNDVILKLQNKGIIG